MSPVVQRRPEPTNAGLHLASTEKLLHTRKAFRRLLRQIGDDPAAAVAAEHVRAYIREVDAVLTLRRKAAA